MNNHKLLDFASPPLLVTYVPVALVYFICILFAFLEDVLLRVRSKSVAARAQTLYEL